MPPINRFGEQNSERPRIESLAWPQHLSQCRGGKVFAKRSNSNDLAFEPERPTQC